MFCVVLDAGGLSGSRELGELTSTVLFADVDKEAVERVEAVSNEGELFDVCCFVLSDTFSVVNVSIFCWSRIISCVFVVFVSRSLLSECSSCAMDCCICLTTSARALDWSLEVSV